VKPATTSAATGRSPVIKGILKTSTTAGTTTSDAPSTPTTKTQAGGVTLDGVATGSPDTRRRGVLRKQLSFETDEPTARHGPPLQQADSAATGAPATGDLEGQTPTAKTTTKIKNRAVARRLMLRDRRSVDDDTMTSFPGDDRTSGDVR